MYIKTIPNPSADGLSLRRRDGEGPGPTVEEDQPIWSRSWDISQARRIRAELHRVCWGAVYGIPKGFHLSPDCVFPRLRGVAFKLLEFHFQEGEILKICSVINHAHPQPEIRGKMRLSVIGFWLRHCDSGNLLPDTCSGRHRSRLPSSSQRGICVKREQRLKWDWGSGGTGKNFRSHDGEAATECLLCRYINGFAKTEQSSGFSIKRFITSPPLVIWLHSLRSSSRRGGTSLTRPRKTRVTLGHSTTSCWSQPRESKYEQFLPSGASIPHQSRSPCLLDLQRTEYDLWRSAVQN